MSLLGNETSLEQQLQRAIRLTVIVLVAVTIMMTLDFQNPIYKGLFIGILVSLQNTILLNRRVKKVSAIKESGQAITYMNRGFIIRLLIIMTTLWLSSKIPSISMNATAVGLFVAPALTFADFFIYIIKESVLKARPSR
ncbi:MAG: ATP synthase subunit I [Firmicutes bacterium]|nr:ATP synthase subunit I [Bacillota bacterium]